MTTYNPENGYSPASGPVRFSYYISGRRLAHAARRPATLPIAFNASAAARRPRLPCAAHHLLCFFKNEDTHNKL
jgi:hypothetical protein